MNVIDDAVDEVKTSEGFRSHMYKCPAGKNTIGYGWNLDEGITKEEAEAIVRMRVNRLHRTMMNTFSYYRHLPSLVQRVLLDMAYNMGFAKLLNFKKMWAALSEHDYAEAANEILDSKYHRDFVKWAGGNIEITRSFKNSETVRNCRHVVKKEEA